MNRRRFLSVAGGTALLAGCTGTGSESPTATDSTASPHGDPGIPVLSFSKVVANPEGDDGQDRNGEVVRLELNADVDAFSLEEFTLTYEPTGRTYTFSAFVSGDMEHGTTVTVHSGGGDATVYTRSPPAYTVFVGSEEPLLANDGGTVTLANPDGVTVDEVTYPSLGPGETYAVPEEN